MIAVLLALAAAAPVTFQVGDVTLAMPAPPGMCLPTGKQAEALQLTAAADRDNVTLVSFLRCGAQGPDALKDLVGIKAPIGMIRATVTREQALTELGRAFNLPAVQNALRSGEVNRRVERNVDRVVPGDKLRTTGDILPFGRDDVCVYMQGTPEYKSVASSYRIAAVVCVTAAGGKVVTVNRIGPDTSAAGLAALRASARSIALTIRKAA